MSISRAGRERADHETEALRRRREPGDRASLAGRHELEEQPPRERHHRAAGDRDEEDERRGTRRASRGRAPREQADAVDDRRHGDHAREAEAVADGGRRTAPRRCTRRPRRRGCSVEVMSGSPRPTVTYSTTNVRAPAKVPSHAVLAARKVATSRFDAEHAPGVRDVCPHALEHASVSAVLGDEHDRDEAGGRDDPGGDEERRRAPEVEEKAASDQAAGDARRRGRRAGRPGPARRRDRAGGPGRARGTAARRRSTRRTARTASAPSSRGSA